MEQRIHQLDNRLANQIAAGEVVERPASVVKELLENSVDADSRRIEVDIERGGSRLIRVIDNGNGIHKDDLTLALSRHATSKILNINDLSAVRSMGFRGEALASIASVSRLLLRSRRSNEEYAWQAHAEGRDMSVKINPAAAAVGTCVEVRDLFFNTPARRKFLRTEKTEFAHIEDVVKRIALAYPEIAINLKHNQKIIKRYPACSNRAELVAKLNTIFGKSFNQRALYFSGELDTIKIEGWLAEPTYHRSESDQQFIFVNQRMVKDRVLTHAIRQSYSSFLPPGRFASYVVFIDCPAQQVDVNVHPTKHEIRFRDPRQIHDFLVKLVEQCLNDVSTPRFGPVSNNADIDSRQTPISKIPASRPYSSRMNSHNRLRSHNVADLLSIYEATLGHQAAEQVDEDATKIENKPCLTAEGASEQTLTGPIFEPLNIVKNRYTLSFFEQQLWLIDLWHLGASINLKVVKTEIRNKRLPLTNHPLIVPQIFMVHRDYVEQSGFYEGWQQLGFEFSPVGENQIALRKLPLLPLRFPVELWLKILASSLSDFNDAFEPDPLIEVLRNSMLNDLPVDLDSLDDFIIAEQIQSLPSEQLCDWQASSIRIDTLRIAQYLGKSW